MSSELVQALDRLRDSVDSLRLTMEAARRNPQRPADVYIEDLDGLRESGLIDKDTYARKRNGFLDKL
jgi:hypothetical protein